MARCTGCGSDPGPNARFCPVCGTQIGQPTLGPGQTQQPTQQPPAAQMHPTILPHSGAHNAPNSPTGQFSPYGSNMPPAPITNDDGEGKRKIAVAVGAGAALILIAGLIFLSATGLLSARRPEAPSGGVLTAPPAQPAQAPVLTAPAPVTPTPAPVLAAPAPKGNPMPEDVIAYLRWLKQYEAGRHQLENKSFSEFMLVMQEVTKQSMTGGLLGVMDDDPSQPESKPAKAFDTTSINTVIRDWNQATAIFQGRIPPDPCATLASHYNRGMTSSVTTMSSLLGGAVSAVQSILSADGAKTAEATQTLTNLLTEYKSKSSSSQIDQSFEQSNIALDDLRSRYTDIPPDIDRGQFQIKAGSGSLSVPGLSVPGLGL